MRVCAYCRVSTGSDAQMVSYDNQIELAVARIESTPGWEFAGVYADPAITGTNDNRPEFQRMMKDAAEGRFDIILTKSISRLSRDTLLTIKTVRELKKYGVSVIFEKENIDTGKPYSEMMLTVMGAFAQEESRNTSERVKKGVRMRAANGECNWVPLYGYTREGDKEFIIVEEEAAVVRRIFDCFEHGMEPLEISTLLNEEGVAGRRGGRWTPNGIVKLTGNEKYKGDVRLWKTYIEDHMTHKQVLNHGEVDQVYLQDHHTGIVTREQFDRVQVIRKLRLSGQAPFGALIICPHCGKSLKKVTSPARGYWGCAEDRFFLRGSKIEAAVLNAYNSLDLSDVDDGSADGADSAKTLTLRIRTGYPKMDKVDYWWVDDLIERIDAGAHSGEDDRNLVVHWRCGKVSDVPTYIRTPWEGNARTRGEIDKITSNESSVSSVSSESSESSESGEDTECGEADD